MSRLKNNSLFLKGVFLILCAPAYAAVHIVSMTPSISSPRPIGAQVTWTVTATDTNPGPLTFQFNTAIGARPVALAQDFNVGTLSSGTWTSQPFAWSPTQSEGVYQIQVVIKDFTSGETASHTSKFQVTPLVTGSSPVVVATANPMVALFSAPSCPAGSYIHVTFHPTGTLPVTTTNWAACHPPTTMNFEIAGMYADTEYSMHSQTSTGSVVTNGPVVNFTTGSPPADITFPTFTVKVAAGPNTDTTDGMILHAFNAIAGSVSLQTATDLAGNTNWYYTPSNPATTSLLTRLVKDGTLLAIESANSWNPFATEQQAAVEFDFVGNTVHETNTGVIQQQLLAMGFADAGPCNVFPSPAPVGSACLQGFSHEIIRMPNGYTATLVSIEKIFPPGTQGDTSGLPVDIMGDAILVLDTNWQAVWFWEAFQHDGGGTQLDINRPAVLGETCANGTGGCPPVYLLGPGIAPKANDWMHSNSLYYWPQNGDILLSSRHQDWVMKIDYNNGTGTGNILWRLGPCGDFSFNNIYNDPWPWNSHQHDAGFQNNGAGPLTLFDNGDTRVSPPTGPGSSTGCMAGTGSGNSRGIAYTVDEATMTITPVLSVDLGVYASAVGAADLLSDGNYFFQPGLPNSYSIEIFPTVNTDTGTQVLNLQGASSYRAWQIPSMYEPPIT